jgi:hypothetical protein
MELCAISDRREGRRYKKQSAMSSELDGISDQIAGSSQLSMTFIAGAMNSVASIM